MEELQLSYLNDQDRLNAYNLIVGGTQHLWSKNQLQEDKFEEVANTFVKLAEEDPLFLAHFTSYAIKNLDSKDLKVVSTFFNALSDADGTPFMETDKRGVKKQSKYKKPNLRTISQAAIQELNPKLVKRVVDLANLKKSYGNKYKEGTHFPNSLKTSIKKYVRFREKNPKAIEGVKKTGLGKTFENLYRMVHISPSTEAAEILRWTQKDGREIKKKEALSFDRLSDREIAEKIREEKISPLVALGALPTKISPVIAVSILEQATGNQAVISHSLFQEQGLLEDEEVQKLFEEKLSTAKDALDRVERINTEVSETVKKSMDTAKSESRKEQVGDIGKVFVHIDISPSMHQAVEFAKQRGAIIAECISNPEENFFWGAFNEHGYIIEKPKEFTQGAFMSALYGLRSGGSSTNCLACYPKARELGCDVDIFITDQEHNTGNIKSIIDRYGKPKAAVIVNFGYGEYGEDGMFYNQLIINGVPTSIVNPNTLTESALVAQAVKTAIKGASATIDQIMETSLLELPPWWASVESK